MTRFWRDPALPFVESRRASESRACYRPHSHPTLSIGVVDSGESDFRCQQRHERLTPGSLVSVPAEVVHACNPHPGQRWSYQMLHLDPAWVRRVLVEADADAALPHEVILSRLPCAYHAFCHLNALLFSARPSMEKEAALIDFVTERLWMQGTSIPLAPAMSLRIIAIKHQLLAQIDQPPSLTTLATEHGLSRYQLIRLFRRECGLPPHAWMLDQRIRRARHRLSGQVALAELALELGFADQGHFQRAFKERVATTPRRYRQT